MKTTIQIKNDIALLAYNTTPAAKTEREKLTQLLRYIETNPSEETIQKQLSQLEKNIQILMSRYDAWKQSNQLLVKSLTDKGKNPELHYYQITKISHLREQAENLKYLLE